MSSSIGGEVTNFKKKRLQDNGDYESFSDYLTVFLDDQVFGIPVLQIQDVLKDIKFTRVPLSPKEVSGSLNLRGRIVTAINVRERLGLPVYAGEKKPLSVVVEFENELYSLVIDGVEDVLSIYDKDIEDSPPTLDQLWRDISMGVHRMEKRLMIMLDVSKLLQSVH